MLEGLHSANWPIWRLWPACTDKPEELWWGRRHLNGLIVSFKHSIPGHLSISTRLHPRVEFEPETHPAYLADRSSTLQDGARVFLGISQSSLDRQQPARGNVWPDLRGQHHSVGRSQIESHWISDASSRWREHSWLHSPNELDQLFYLWPILIAIARHDSSQCKLRSAAVLETCCYKTNLFNSNFVTISTTCYFTIN